MVIMARMKYLEAIGREAKRGRPLKGKNPNKEDLSKLYFDENMTAEEIGQSYGCSQDTILRLLEGYGLRERERVNKLKDKSLDALKELVANKGVAKAAFQLGVDRKTLYRNIKRLEKENKDITLI